MSKPSPEDVLHSLKSTCLPVEACESTLGPDAGLVIIDIVKGFAEVGAGPLAPSSENAQVSRMILETSFLAGEFLKREQPVVAFLDTHIPGKAEPPYPPHCESGSGQEDFVEELKWLETESQVLKIRKDCINGFIGSINSVGENVFSKWIRDNSLRQLLVVGICTDICVMDFVLTTLSARNHGMLGDLKDVIVYEPGCATYDLSVESAVALGLPKTAAHPQMIAHHIGLYSMASRGAAIASSVEFA